MNDEDLFLGSCDNCGCNLTADDSEYLCGQCEWWHIQAVVEARDFIGSDRDTSHLTPADIDRADHFRAIEKESR